MADGGVMLGASLLFAIELAVLYAAGSYVMGRLMWISGFGGSGSVMGRVGFYLLAFPGVVLHEGTHYLVCLLTRTKSLALHHSLQVGGRTMVASCLATFVMSAAHYL